MPTYKTPDVYVEEISVFPPSVAEVPTAIPVFVGYTEKADKAGMDLKMKPTAVKSLLEYEQYFGRGSKPTSIEVEVVGDDNQVKTTKITPRFFLYESLRLYFDNNGGRCYIVSVGGYAGAVDKALLAQGLDAAGKEDEPTMLVIPDAVLAATENDTSDIQQAMLRQCARLQDRVAILDVRGATEDGDAKVTAFRNGIGMNALKYGAAYYPYLRANLPLSIRFSDISLKKAGGAVLLADISSDRTSVDALVRAAADVTALRTSIKTLRSAASGAVPGADNKAALEAYAKAITDLAKGLVALSPTATSESMKKNLQAATDGKSSLAAVVRKLSALDSGYVSVVVAPAAGAVLGAVKAAEFPADYALPAAANNVPYAGKTVEAEAVGAARGAFKSLVLEALDAADDVLDVAEDRLKADEEIVASTNPTYRRILDAIAATALTLPPSGAIAGVYAYVDAVRGVWKAPANVSLATVVAPAIAIDSGDQASLNVDTEAGKSVNAIRAFAGKGVLVWGARTLAGNDNEWRYVSVRRFFNTAEESIKKSTYWAVFEPNDANLWMRVKAMIENYLTQKWRDGALAGAKPNDAFFVKVGLGITMSPQDVLEGRLNVEIGMAVVRPAEFIVLKFSHKMQTS